MGFNASGDSASISLLNWDGDMKIPAGYTIIASGIIIHNYDETLPGTVDAIIPNSPGNERGYYLFNPGFRTARTTASAKLTLKKVGTPGAALIDVEVLDGSGALIGTIGTKAANTLTGTFADYLFTGAVIIPAATPFYIGARWEGSDGANYPVLGSSTIATNQFFGELGLWTGYSRNTIDGYWASTKVINMKLTLL